MFPGRPHHVVPRGRSHQDVFGDDDDRLRFLDIVRTAAREAGLEVWAYALMRNHVHMIVVPEDRESISDAMARALIRYTRSFNRRHGVSGKLWHRRCHSSVIQPRCLWAAVRYVERNPVRAGIVPWAQDYRWSSAAYHCGLLKEDLLVGPAAPLKGSLADWSSWLAEPDRDPRLVYLRRKSRQSQPNRNPEFIELLEHDLDRRISRQ